MFLHVSVILSTGSVCPSACWDAHPLPDQRQAPPWDQRQAPSQGQRQAPPPRPEADPFPPGAVHAGRYGQQAGGTHPTGMHSCLYLIFCHTVHQKKNLNRSLFHSFRL